MHHEAMRSSQLTGVQITGSTGSEIGTISDTIINPALGRLEFAVISLNNAPATTATGATAGTPSSTGITSSTSAVGGKQVAVPWMLLRPGSASAASTAGSVTGSQQQSFVFMGDASKLESAPNFDANTDLSTPSWRQSVFSYFGLSGRGSATGGAETPGGTTSSGSTFPGSGSSPDKH
jgi:sporulation protein YlmC with PRC-barrel domain